MWCVITSYSIHYTKLYDEILEKYSQHRNPTSLQEGSIAQNMSAMVVQELRQQLTASWKRVNEYCINDDIESFARHVITSYSIHYTKLYDQTFAEQPESIEVFQLGLEQ